MLRTSSRSRTQCRRKILCRTLWDLSADGLREDACSGDLVRAAGEIRAAKFCPAALGLGCMLLGDETRGSEKEVEGFRASRLMCNGEDETA
mmetsp:Transcript_15368/g.26903  ORF Transcript_15368/g.26903 Transcript_15368/m.26903 type:complete len:91 (+) Transcript_15368:149-421(+)